MGNGVSRPRAQLAQTVAFVFSAEGVGPGRPRPLAVGGRSLPNARCWEPLRAWSSSRPPPQQHERDDSESG